MKGETYERRKMVDLKPSAHIGTDLSIPDRDDHLKHIAAVAKSNGGRGFPVMRL